MKAAVLIAATPAVATIVVIPYAFLSRTDLKNGGSFTFGKPPKKI